MEEVVTKFAATSFYIDSGGGLAVWGGVNLLEGFGNDNPGAKSQGMKQFMLKC
ncbi:MAG: Maff2 family protein [Pseudobutyrivibrio sp.]|nr:Maff2 family protein [Pseudobutyrivibrio sp.]